MVFPSLSRPRGHRMAQRKQQTCPDCDADDSPGVDRRGFLRSVTAGTAAAVGGLPLWAVPRAAAAPSPSSAAETLVKTLYGTLTEKQKKDICFGWDYRHPERGLLRTHV